MLLSRRDHGVVFMDAAVFGILGLILIMIPSAILFVFQTIMYHSKNKYRAPVPRKDLKTGRISIIIPIRKEPSELLDDALKYLSGLNIDKEVIIVSDDPRDRLEEIRAIIEKWRKKGLDVAFIWRSEARGFRTGALNVGLYASRGKYVYVMDIDSRIDEKFLVEAAKLIEDGKADAVVARWAPKNSDSRVAEAIAYSMKFVVDTIYKGRAGRGLPVFPLGTGTLYKADMLKNELKGWDEKRIQDDMEIGSRMMKLGKKILYHDKYKVLVEVPRRYRSLRIQQERWAYGALDVAIARFKDIITSPYPLLARLDSLVFLLQYTPAVLGIIGVIILGLACIVYPIDYIGTYWYIGIPWIISAALYAYSYIDSLREIDNDLWHITVNLGRSSATTVSLTPTFTYASFKALFRRPFIYKRTPKGKHESKAHGYRVPWELIIGVSTASFGLYLCLTGILYTGLWFITYSLGYLYSCYRWFEDIIRR